MIVLPAKNNEISYNSHYVKLIKILNVTRPEKYGFLLQ